VSAYREIGLSAVKDLAVKEVQGFWSTPPPASSATEPPNPPPSFASNSVRRGVGVEDTAAPRSASGRSLTPTPHPERAHMQAKDAKGKINTSLTSLDQPRSWNDL